MYKKLKDKRKDNGEMMDDLARCLASIHISKNYIDNHNGDERASASTTLRPSQLEQHKARNAASSLPLEILTMILNNLEDADDLADARLANHQLLSASWPKFRQFFTICRVSLDCRGLAKLVAVSQHPQLAHAVRNILFQLPNRHLTSREVSRTQYLLLTGRAVKLMSKAFDNLEACRKERSTGDFRSDRGPDLAWPLRVWASIHTKRTFPLLQWSHMHNNLRHVDSEFRPSFGSSNPTHFQVELAVAIEYATARTPAAKIATLWPGLITRALLLSSARIEETLLFMNDLDASASYASLDYEQRKNNNQCTDMLQSIIRRAAVDICPINEAGKVLLAQAPDAPDLFLKHASEWQWQHLEKLTLTCQQRAFWIPPNMFVATLRYLKLRSSSASIDSGELCRQLLRISAKLRMLGWLIININEITFQELSSLDRMAECLESVRNQFPELEEFKITSRLSLPDSKRAIFLYKRWTGKPHVHEGFAAWAQELRRQRQKLDQKHESTPVVDDNTWL